MKVVGVDKKNKVVFVEDVRDGIELLSFVEKGYKIIKVDKIRAV